MSADGGHSGHWRLSKNTGTKGKDLDKVAPLELLLLPKLQEATKLYALGVSQRDIGSIISKGAAEGDLSGHTNNSLSPRQYPINLRPSRSSCTAAIPRFTTIFTTRLHRSFRVVKKTIWNRHSKRFFADRQQSSYRLPATPVRPHTNATLSHHPTLSRRPPSTFFNETKEGWLAISLTFKRHLDQVAILMNTSRRAATSKR